MIDVRLRSRIAKAELDELVGKIVTPNAFSMVITDAATVYKPNGELLLVYVPNAIPEEVTDVAREHLRSIKVSTNRRGLAAGAGTFYSQTGKQRGGTVHSALLGSFEPQGGYFPMCRLTAWTANHVSEWHTVQPFFRAMSDVFEKHVPDRFKTQVTFARRTQPDWVIAGTPYTTITVNNTYATGVHTDKGDLHEGFSCLAVLRHGDYGGGQLCFPEFRVAVDLKDRDMILMDAHEWHGNVQIEKRSPDAERVSIVAYYRTEIAHCDTKEAEALKAERFRRNLIEEDV